MSRYIARPIQQYISEAKAFIEKVKKGYSNNSYCYWVLCLKDNPAFIGSICLWNFSEDGTIAETGYEMLPEHYGKGYMHEALGAIVEYAFGVLKLIAIEAFTHCDNIRSKNLLEKSGFLRCEGRVDEDVETNVIYRKAEHVKL